MYTCCFLCIVNEKGIGLKARDYGLRVCARVFGLRGFGSGLYSQVFGLRGFGSRLYSQDFGVMGFGSRLKFRILSRVTHMPTCSTQWCGPGLPGKV